MSDDTLKRLCKCGCHQDTHFEKAGACLGVRCDCPRYRVPGTPDELPPRPNHASWCRCFFCKQHNASPPDAPDEDDVTTWPMFPAAHPWTP